MDTQVSKRGLNANHIKLIAIIAMTVDHLTWTLAPGFDTRAWVIALHVIGRITAPIMWFFVAEGYHYTKNLKKYALRLLILALVSHFAYCFCFGIQFLPFSKGEFFNQTGVVWSLLGGLVLCAVSDSEKIKTWLKFVIIAAVCLLTFPSDWSCVAAVSIMYISHYRGNFKKQMLFMMIWTFTYALIYFIFIDKIYALVQLCTCLSIPFLRLYNGERGKWRGMKWLYYIYYPAHLAVCGIIRLAVHGDIPTIF